MPKPQRIASSAVNAIHFKPCEVQARIGKPVVSPGYSAILKMARSLRSDAMQVKPYRGIFDRHAFNNCPIRKEHAQTACRRDGSHGPIDGEIREAVIND